MKSLIVYYSFSGNTKKAAEVLNAVLKPKGETTVQRLVPENETRNFFAQCLQARLGTRVPLSGKLDFEVSGYDLICIGTPVWAFAPTPAINTYLDRLSGAEGKSGLIFTTFGSGVGVRGTVKAIKKRLAEKGVSKTKELNIQMMKVDDSDFVRKRILDLQI